MNKKFLSAILFGALMVTSTGTFVSCKDYDDDIENLQGQIDKLATKEDMTSQIATLQAALETAKTDAAAAKKSAEESLAKATAAEKAAAQAALDAANAKLDAIKAAQDEVAKVKTELEATIDSKFEAAKSDLAKTIAELTEKVTELTGLTTDMITSLDLQSTDKGNFGLDLKYYQIAEGKKWDGKDSYTFGKDLEGNFDVHAGEIFATPASLLVSVAPVNAVLPNHILSIVDSEGISINDYINLTTAAYTEKLYKSSRAIAGNGLYAITAELKKDADKAAFAKLLNDGKTPVKYVAFALAASNKERTVTSTYDITITSGTASIIAAAQIDEKSTIKSSIEKEGTLKAWNGYNGSTTSTTATPNDEYCYPVVKGEAFQIKVVSEGDVDATKTTSKVMASYVVVDKENKALSTTDKQAINGMTFDGVNTVSKTNLFNITISGANAKGVVVPLKVVTIDYTGAETSRVVWVKAGENTLEQAVEYALTPSTHVATPTVYTENGYVAAFKIPAGATKYSISLVAGEEKVGTDFTTTTYQNLSYSGAVNTIFKFYKSYTSKDKNETATKASEVAYAEFVGAVNLKVMKENVAYEGTVKFFDAENTYLGVSTIKVKKVLPTAFPAAFSAKTNAINEGVLTVYPEPETAPATTGVFAFSKAFNGLDGVNALSNIVFSSTDVNLIGDDDNAANAAFTNGSTYTINTINPDIINDGKTYGAKVAYDYGDIAYEYTTVVGTKSNNWSVDWATKFSIKFGCMIMDSNYAWTSTPVVYYNEDATIKTAKKDVISVLDAYKAAMDPFKDAANWNKWAAVIDASTKVTLKTTNEAGQVIENEFFTAAFEKQTDAGDYKDKWALKLTKKSTEVVLKDDVKTDVVITITDKFGHEHNVPALSFTMKKSH